MSSGIRTNYSRIVVNLSKSLFIYLWKGVRNLLEHFPYEKPSNNQNVLTSSSIYTYVWFLGVNPSENILAKNLQQLMYTIDKYTRNENEH